MTEEKEGYKTIKIEDYERMRDVYAEFKKCDIRSNGTIMFLDVIEDKHPRTIARYYTNDNAVHEIAQINAELSWQVSNIKRQSERFKAERDEYSYACTRNNQLFQKERSDCLKFEKLIRTRDRQLNETYDILEKKIIENIGLRNEIEKLKRPWYKKIFGL